MKFRKNLMALVALFTAAIISWIVNDYLSHSKPVMTITNVRFLYDFPKPGDEDFEKSRVQLGVDDTARREFLNRVPKSMHTFGVKPDTHLSDIKGIFRDKGKKKLENDLRRDRRLLKTMLLLLSEELDEKQEFVATHWIAMLEESNIIPALAFGNFSGKITLPKLTKNMEVTLTDSAPRIKNLWRLGPNSWLKFKLVLEKDANGLLFFDHWAVISYYIIMKNYDDLQKIFESTDKYLTEAAPFTLSFLNELINKTTRLASAYRKAEIRLRILNDSEFPVAVSLTNCTIAFANARKKEVSSKNCELIQPEKNQKNSDDRTLQGTVYSAIVISQKDFVDITVRSKEPFEPDTDKSIQILYKGGQLDARVTINIEDPLLLQSNTLGSRWTTIPKP